MRFHQLIRAKRGKESQRGVAHHLGVSLSTFARAEKGEIVDSLAFARLAVWLGMDANALIEQYLEDHAPSADPVESSGEDGEDEG